MKYRRLEPEELQELESEFVQFLATNSVTGPDWEALKLDQPERAEALIGVFSDLVFDKVIRKVTYLEWVGQTEIRAFHCLADVLRLNGLRISGETSIDLTAGEDSGDMLGRIRQEGSRVQIYSAEKDCPTDRDQQVFNLMQAGALISRDGQYYHLIESLKSGAGSAG